MKIAFFTDGYWPTVGGVVTSVLQRLILLAESGHEILVIAPSPPRSAGAKPNFHKNIKTHFSPSVSLGFKTGFRLAILDPRLYRLVKKFDPDVVHTNVPFTIGFQGLLIGKKLNKPLVTTHYTNYSDAESLKFFGLPKTKITEKLQQKFGQKVIDFINQHHKVVTLSVDSKKDIKNQGVDRPITVIPSPIDIKALNRGKENGLLLKKKLGIDKALIYIGRISGEKNIDLILKVFKLLYEKNPDLKLVLVGDGQVKSRLEKLCQSLKIDNKIIWIGSVSHEKLIAGGYFYLGDIFITLSEFETQGISTVEAMACGLPVIGANARATTEIVKNAGILVDVKDLKFVAEKTHEILSDKKLYNKLSKQSLERAKEFSQSKVLNKLESVYHDVTNQVGP